MKKALITGITRQDGSYLAEFLLETGYYVTIWRSGRPKWEFLCVDDMAKACIHLMNLDKSIYQKYTLPMCSHINARCNEDISIKELAVMIKNIVNYKGKINFHQTKPDGAPRKLLDSTSLNNLGFDELNIYKE